MINKLTVPSCDSGGISVRSRAILAAVSNTFLPRICNTSYPIFSTSLTTFGRNGPTIITDGTSSVPWGLRRTISSLVTEYSSSGDVISSVPFMGLCIRLAATKPYSKSQSGTRMTTLGLRADGAAGQTILVTSTAISAALS
ncbi:hypothetical protein SDC9_136690 [bioreactor metagenome]|uniref:Uncharacterized protein n=1 Tax=bioreactor metagenome TaxID=1076179 RepID=A0A645DKI6_9ZZZZ